ncbi:hypothetical protein HK405_005184, partial [Cladochytrium tenue]
MASPPLVADDPVVPAAAQADTDAIDPVDAVVDADPAALRSASFAVGVSEAVGISVLHLSVHARSRTAGRLARFLPHRRPRSSDDDTVDPEAANAAAAGSRSNQPHAILSDVSLSVPAGQLMAIMGGSGSGKTTLLNALAGRTTSADVSGTVRFNGRPPAHYIRRRAVAYVQQQDSLLPYLSVRDTLRYAARLRLPRSMSLRDKYAMVEQVILELGLKECADTIVGDEWRKGISGGEKRRVSVGVQLLVNPAVIFMDEPTTGLDAFSARSLIETLKLLCRNGRTIIISIHQPRSDIFSAFEHVALLSRGHLCYAGPQPGAVPFIEALGYPLVGNVNGADFLIDATSVDDRSPEAEAESRARVDAIIAAWAAIAKRAEAPAADEGKTADKLDVPKDEDEKAVFASHQGATIFEQIQVLTGRLLRNMVEDRLTLWGSVLEVLIMGVVLGYIFFHLENTARLLTGFKAGILGRKSLLYSCCALQNYLCLMFIIWKLSNEMSVFDRERADKMYSVPAYLISWFSVNLVLYAILATIFSVIVYFMTGLRTDDLGYHLGLFICANALMQSVTISRDFASASLTGNALVTFLTMSSGFFIPITSIPIYLRWFERISFITYGLRLLIANEFSSNTFGCSDASCDGDSIVRSIGFTPGDIRGPIGGLCVIFAVKVVVTAILLELLQHGGVKQSSRVKTQAGKNLAHVTPQSIASDMVNRDASPVTVSLELYSLTFRRVRGGLFPAHGTAAIAGSERPILQQLNASFRPGELSAILGVSGAGKSTLLQQLHARLPRLPAHLVAVREGRILHNDIELSKAEVAACTASVRQDDSHLLPALTARETLQYAALIRLPGSLAREQKLRRAEDILVELGLRDCADTLVGGGAVKGLSGGEKRRLSVGLALLTNPNVLLLDEPTSGLDAATARHMMATLKSIAAQGRTVVCTVHQPRSDIFPMLDKLMLLARGGRLVYDGPGSRLVPYLADRDLPCPPLTNPADFALDVSSVDLRNQAAEDASRRRVDALIAAWREAASSAAGGASPRLSVSSPGSRGSARPRRPKFAAARAPWTVVLPLLVSRSFTNLRRQPDLVMARVLQVAALAVILTLYFVNLGHGQDSVTSRIGVLQSVGPVIFVGMLNCLAVFPQELLLFRFENQDGAYSVESFFWTYTVNELPFEILGSFLFALLFVYAIGMQINIFLAAFAVFCYVNTGESIGIAFCSFISQPGFSVQLMSSMLSVMNIMQGFL